MFDIQDEIKIEDVSYLRLHKIGDLIFSYNVVTLEVSLYENEYISSCILTVNRNGSVYLDETLRTLVDWIFIEHTGK